MKSTLVLALLPALVGCTGGHTIDDTSDPGLVDDTVYAFDSAFEPGTSSVSYSGQIFRQLLISDMKAHMGDMTDRLDEGSWYPEPGEVEAELGFYFDFNSDAYGSLEHGYATNGVPLQLTYDDVSSGKDLAGKIAGNDETGQHVDWSTEFVGWEAEGVTTPESLVRHWFATVDAQAVAWANGDLPLAPSGSPVPAVYVDAQGRDYRQLTQKFLGGAIALSQAADDYLDDDLDGKGLNSAHDQADEGAPYTPLEHAWDEGFGYFGAAISYPQWTDGEIAESPDADIDGDGFVDLLTEVNWGHSQNAAKRDLGAVVATDFTAEAWGGFHAGRTLLAQTAGSPLSADQLAQLQGHRDQALGAWEAAISATVVHYINDVLADMNAMDSDAYDFGDHAKHWSELKGFALCFQFNPRSPLSDAEFEELHELVGQAPVLADADADTREAYASDLIEARALLGQAYGFDSENLGDELGENGW